MDARHRSPVFVDPPLPSWPNEVHPFEPVHGYFQRLAQRNGLSSVPVIMDSLGYLGRRPAPEHLLAIANRFPGVDTGSLARSTASIGDYVELNGQVFRKGDFSFRRPRVCSECLKEAHYYRNWFDLQIIDACPIHEMTLEGQGEAAKLAWWFPKIGVYPDGGQAKSRRVSFSVAWEAYLLGRMGLMKAYPNELLDGFSLSEVTTACLILGRGLDPGRDGTERSVKRLTLAPVIRRGFAILSQGKDGVAAAFRSQFVIASSELKTSGLHLSSWRRLGWLREAIANCADSPLLKIIESIAEGAAAELNIYSRKRLPDFDVVDRPLTLKEVSQKLGIKPQRVLEIGKYLGIARNQRASGLWHSFSPGSVAEIKSALDQLAPRREAIELSGLPKRDFDLLVARGVIAPVTKLGGGSLGCDHFLKRDLSDLAHKMCAIRSEPRLRLPRRVPPVRAGMSTTQVANALGVSVVTVRDLAARGHLAVTPGPQFRGKPLFDEKTVGEFGQRYVAASSLSTYLSCRGCDVARILTEGGVQLLPASPGTTRLVAKSELSRVFGNVEESPETRRFFVGLSQHWAQTKSVSAIKRWSGDAAIVSSGGKHAVAEVRFHPSRIEIVVTADAQTSPRRYRVLDRVREDVRGFWSSARINQARPGHYELVDELAVHPAEVPEADVFRWIDDRMDRMRWLLSPNREREGVWELSDRTAGPHLTPSSIEI
ncbi:MAG: TniQ family protein [Caulobacter sp.]